MKQLFITICSLVLCASCSFRSPTIKEQEKLVENGAFPGGTPPWIVSDAHPEATRRLSGVVPNTFAITDKKKEKERRLLPKKKEETEIRQLPAGYVEQDRTEPERLKRDDSPIQQITDVCPGIENLVTDAVTTEDTAQRLIKYQQLISRCKRSDVLWFWLGKEYLLEGNQSEARRCLGEAVRINPRHLEAKGLLSQIKAH